MGSVFGIPLLLTVVLVTIVIVVVDAWLDRIGAPNSKECFFQHGIDDFFCLPFLRSEVLVKMKVPPQDEKLIMQEVMTLRSMDSILCTLFALCKLHVLIGCVVVGLWLECLGYGMYAPQFIKEKIRISVSCAVVPLALTDLRIDFALVEPRVIGEAGCVAG